MQTTAFKLLLILAAIVPTVAADSAQQRARLFLEMYNPIAQRLHAVANEADWKASTDVSEEHTGQRVGANEMRAAFQGNPYIIETVQDLLKSKKDLDALTARQLEMILFAAGSYPGTLPDMVAQRVKAEAKQSETLDGFEFRYAPPGQSAPRKINPNEITELLVKSDDLEERRRVWEASKESGIALRGGLIELQTLRNTLARKMGYSSFFGFQVSEYGMSVNEMMALTDRLNAEIKPLYEQLHCWTRHELAKRFNQPVPKLIPAHWLGNRWGQEWPGLVKSVDMDAPFKSKTPEWLAQQAERFYTSIGYQKLPQSFWEKSDLYELPADSKRKKNTHASAWHVDLNHDVRSLMSVRSNFEWLQTTHHELGHVYYFLAYSNPQVPLTLREGANRAFHEAVGDLIGIAAAQPPYLREIGLLDKNAQIDATQYLLNQALNHEIVFVPWSAGVMTRWEHDFYEKDLSTNEYNKRWWEYVARYQGIAPPSVRGESFCDAATKTHINDDPAQYYDYALAFAIKYQLHMHIAKNILKQDPHSCSYYGNKAVGDFLWNILKVGRTRDWRELLREATGEEISAQPMLEYFAPVMEWLKEQNKGRQVGWN